MTEYFIGIIPPAEIYDLVISVQKRYISRLGIEPHITLKAQSGLDSDEEWIDIIEEVLHQTPSFEVKVNDINYFGNDVMFIEVLSSELTALHNELVNRLDIKAEDRKKYFEGKNFHAHITVAKTTYPSGLADTHLNIEDLKAMEAEIRNELSMQSFWVNEVCIYKKQDDSYGRYRLVKLREERENEI